VKLFSEYLTEAMSINDWFSILALKTPAEKLPPDSELKKLLIQAPTYGMIVLHYYMDKGVTLSKDLWLSAVKHNKPTAGLIPEELLTPEFMMELVKLKPNVLNIFFERGLTVPEDVIQTAVRKLPANITQVKKPSEELKLLAVSKNGSLIKGFHNPSKELLNAALTEPKFVKSEKDYNKFVKQQFKDNTVLMNKWLRYGDNMRSM
jgi:hypothetical protein